MNNPSLNNIHILIVDDRVYTRILVRRILNALGFSNLSEAKCVDTAWNSILLSPPDILILDWEMEGAEGIELVRRIRTADGSPDKYMPILMLTAHADMAHIIEARDAGANEFVSKPIIPKSLYKHLMGLIETPRKFIRVGNFFGPDRRRKKRPFDGPDRRKQLPEPEPAPQEAAPANHPKASPTP